MSIITNQANVTSKYTLSDYVARTNDITSNTVSTENISDEFFKNKIITSSYAAPNDEVQQILTLTNNSSHVIKNIIIYDTITDGATFKEGSVVVEGTPYPLLDPRDGIAFPISITPQKSASLLYNIVVDKNPSVSTVTAISNVSYQVDDSIKFSENSNRASFSIINNVIDIQKSTNVTAVISGQRLTYTHIITNSGEFKNTDLFFQDVLPSGTTFIPESVKINNVEQSTLDPTIGFNLEDLEAGQSIKVEFDVNIT